MLREQVVTLVKFVEQATRPVIRLDSAPAYPVYIPDGNPPYWYWNPVVNYGSWISPEVSVSTLTFS
jgi:hypothetical protein